HDRGVLPVLLGGDGQDRAEDVHGLGDAALAEQPLHLVHGGGDVGLLRGGRGRRGGGGLRRGRARAIRPGGLRAQERAGGVQGRAGGRSPRGEQLRQVLVDLLRGVGAVL